MGQHGQRFNTRTCFSVSSDDMLVLFLFPGIPTGDPAIVAFYDKRIYKKLRLKELSLSDHLYHGNYEYIIFGQIIFPNFHQFKAFVGLSDCRTIGPSDYRMCRTIGLSDYSYGPVLYSIHNQVCFPKKKLNTGINAA